MEKRWAFAAQNKLTHPAVWIEVDLSRLQANLKALQSFLRPGTGTMAVVKANAYGHGLLPVARALAPHVEWFGVASVAEGIQLRKETLSHPILVFGHLPLEDIRAALEWNLSISLSDADYGLCIQEEAAKYGERAKVHVKIDTGMGRFGLPQLDAEKALLRLARYSHIELEGLYTHFPQSEKSADPYTGIQIERFAALRSDLAKEGLEFKYAHAANSAAIVNYKDSHFNLVRPGLMLYGLYTDLRLRESVRLRPALQLKAKWTHTKRISQGESVGYGRSYIAPVETQIGILPIGYSHGYPWSLSGKSKVLFRGRPYPLAGRVSMDSIAVDLGANGDASIGETVTLLGEEGDSSINAETLAEWAGTIPYEIVTRLQPSLERVYVDGSFSVRL